MTTPVFPNTNPPNTFSSITLSANQREAEQFRRLRQRLATPSGCGVNLLIGAGHNTVTVAFPRQEYDTNYGVLVQPSYETMFYITSKTTDGFTVEFHNNAAAGDYFDYLIFRTEDGLHSISVSPTTASLTVGPPHPTAQLTPTLYDVAGNVVGGYTVKYQSSNAAIASVSSTGLVTGVAHGSATIYALVAGYQATVAVTVA